MSRIFGRAGPGPAGHAARAVDAMIAAAARPQPARRASSASAAIAVTGRGTLASEGQVHAAVDGVVLDGSGRSSERGAAAAQVAALYRQHGLARGLEQIEGEFAIAIHDEATGEVWLVRDRLGVRPLYYWQDGDQLAFASQPGSLVALAEVPRATNRRWVATFAGSHYRYIDNRPDESPFVAIRQVPAGTVIRLEGGRATTSRYWSLEDLGDFTGREETLAEQYRHLLMEAVGARVAMAGRPVFTLSGGMDSSSVLASAVATTGTLQQAISTVYTDKTYDESDEIQTFLAEKVAAWHPIRIENFDLFETVRRMVRAHDEPVATATWLSHFLLCETTAAMGFDTLFGGLGGDELNAGEYEYFVFHFADLARAGRTAALQQEIVEWARHHDHPIYRKSPEVAADLMARLTDPAIPGRIRVEQTRFTKYFGAVARDFFDMRSIEPVLDHPFGVCLKNRTFQDLFRETTPCCLRAEDRNGEAFGLRQVDPFLDRRLVEFMFRVPGTMKIRDGVTKQLLRRAMRGVLPEVTRTRIKKTGWNAPAHLWFNGPAVEQLLDLVRSRAFRERGVYDVPYVLTLIDEHRHIVSSGAVRENHMMFLWQLLNLELWFQEVVDRVPAAAAPAGPER